jgi:hydrogenase/urease accessory protein HupE
VITMVNALTAWGQRVLLLLAHCLLATMVAAHDARPVAITLTEVEPEHFQLTLRIPPTVALDNQPQLVWPANCELRPSTLIAPLVAQCSGGLAGKNFSLRYPLFNPSLATFYRLVPLQGTLEGAGESTAITAMLAPTMQQWQVPAAMTPWRVVRDYTLLGIEHIIGGYDHLLFVFGLLVIARTFRRILLTVTGFTVAHSITLSLSALGFVQVPIAPVEATIALSIVFLAYEISRQQVTSLTYQYPLLVSFSFGLLHGLGFASALGEIGLVANEALLSLLFFNVGVELGQLCFIASVAFLVLLASKFLPSSQFDVSAQHDRKHDSNLGWARRRSDLLASYLIGIPASYWFIERVSQFGWFSA